jgi:spoIIIJ-associated protein
MKKSVKKETTILKEIVKELLEKMGVAASVEVCEDKKNSALLVNISSDKEKGLLIGKRGETLASLQMVLGLILKQRLGEWKRVVVDVGDWREKQEDYLNSLAERTAERVKETGKPESLYNLTASERRLIHLKIGEIGGVVSESTGEGKDRCLVVKPDDSKK